MDRLVGWAIALQPVCDDAFRDRVEQFREQHAELRTARNMHEHLAGYLRERATGKLTRGGLLAWSTASPTTARL